MCVCTYASVTHRNVSLSLEFCGSQPPVDQNTETDVSPRWIDLLKHVIQLESTIFIPLLPCKLYVIRDEVVCCTLKLSLSCHYEVLILLESFKGEREEEGFLWFGMSSEGP